MVKYNAQLILMKTIEKIVSKKYSLFPWLAYFPLCSTLGVKEDPQGVQI